VKIFHKKKKGVPGVGGALIDLGGVAELRKTGQSVEREGWPATRSL